MDTQQAKTLAIERFKSQCPTAMLIEGEIQARGELFASSTYVVEIPHGHSDPGKVGLYVFTFAVEQDTNTARATCAKGLGVISKSI